MRRPRSRRARDKTFSLAPVWSFEIRSDAVTQPNLSEPGPRRSSSQLSSRVLLRTNPFSRTATPSFRGGASRRYKALSAQVPDARGELQPQKMKQGEDDLGVASGVRRVLDRAGPRQSRRPIAELRSNCAERSRGSEGHKAEARAPSGLLPPAPDGDEVSVGTRQRECSDQVIARDFPREKLANLGQLSL